METSRFNPFREYPHLGMSEPETSDWFRVNDHRLYYELHGSGQDPVVALLHHGLGSILSWRRQISAFVNAGWQVLAFDRWGYGRSDPRPELLPGYMRQDASECIALFDHLKLETASIVGHSDGGTIALILAAHYPERIERMALVAAHIYYEPKMGEGLLGIAEAAKSPPLATALAREHGSQAQSLVQTWIDHWLSSHPASLSLRAELPKVACPVLVIQGELDEYATPKHAADITEAVQQGELWLIPGVHHMPPHEIPEKFNQRVLAFLSRERKATNLPNRTGEEEHV